MMGWSGSRLGNSFDSGFYNVLIVAEPAKLTDYTVETVADYITMLALSQPASLDSCQELPSISNLLAKGCVSASRKITDGDLAYLQGLYKVPTGYAFTAQRNEVRATKMKLDAESDRQRRRQLKACPPGIARSNVSDAKAPLPETGISAHNPYIPRCQSDLFPASTMIFR